MPMYDLMCADCGHVQEELVSTEGARERACRRCGGPTRIVWLKPPAAGAPRFQMGAVMSNGEVVPGHFGKEARRDPLKRKK